MPRTRLLARLMDPLAPPNVWIEAPAGSGKTTLLAQWAAAADMPVAWLTLDPAANDPDRFLQMLQAACAHLTGHVPDLEDDESLTDWINQIARLLAQAGGPVALVFDEGEHLVNPVVLGAIDQLASHRPANLRMLIASRRRLDLALARWRVRGEVLEIGSDDLVLEHEEIAEAIAGIVEPGEVDPCAASILRVTGGWAAGVGLGRLALGRLEVGDELEMDSSLRQAIGQNASEFFIDEILSSQPAERVDFLLRTSILTELTPEICEEVFGFAWSLSMLADIERAGLFLSRIASTPPIWRYHDLFATALRHAFEERLGAAEVRRAHLACAGWFERAGLTDQALHHALQAREFDLARRLVVSTAASLIDAGSNVALASRLDALNSMATPLSGDLLYWRCLVMMKTGNYDALHADLAALAALWEGTTFAVQIVRLASLKAALAFHLSQFETAHTEAARAVAAGSHLPASETSLAQTILLGSLVFSGRMAEADRAQRTMIAGDSPSDLVLRLYAGEIAFANCELRAAERVLSSALDDYATHTSLSYVFVMMTMVRISIEWNELERAEALIRRIEALEQQLPHRAMRWLVDRLFTVLALTRNDFPAARDAATVMLQALPPVTPPDRRHYAHMLHAVAHDRAGDSQFVQPLLALKPPTGSTDWDVRSALMLAHLRERSGDADGALRLVQQVRNRAAQDGRFYDVLTSSMMEAAVQTRAGNRDMAVASLERAIPLAIRGGCVQCLLVPGAELLELLASLEHNQGARRLLESVRRVEIPPGAESPTDLLEAAPRALTPREQEILRLAELGLTNIEIGNALGIALPTVKRHLTNIFSKLGVRNRTEATRQLRRGNVAPRV